jgi:transmembrane 9 superfamily protein 2/4
MVFAVLGFLSPANRGSLMVALILMFVAMGYPAGYVSAVFCKMFRGAGTDRLRSTLLTATVFPGVVFCIFFMLNLLIWGDRSTGAVPFSTLLALLFFWFGMSLPMVFAGSWLGFRREALEHPVRTNPIPRQVPQQVWFMQAVPSILMGGVLPFGVVFVELFFILSSIWQHRFYYLFGFMLLVPPPHPHLHVLRGPSARCGAGRSAWREGRGRWGGEQSRRGQSAWSPANKCACVVGGGALG